jgi:hypothetical protein
VARGNFIVGSSHFPLLENLNRKRMKERRARRTAKNNGNCESSRGRTRTNADNGKGNSNCL